MKTYLEEILRRKREELPARQRAVPLEALRAMPGYDLPRRSLVQALRSRTPAVIAEIKAASPSLGTIRDPLDVAAIARSYVGAGAAALSVLTDEPFFRGRLDHLLLARAGHDVPVLRKDFIVDPYQVHQARAYGADAILLIVAALEQRELLGLRDLARDLGLEVLVEVHTEEELARLDGADFPLVGVNNRDLATFVTDMATTIRLRGRMPAGSLCVSESGIRTADDIRRLRSHGVHAFLIGETFMRAQDPGAALRALLEAGEEGVA